LLVRWGGSCTAASGPEEMQNEKCKVQNVEPVAFHFGTFHFAFKTNNVTSPTEGYARQSRSVAAL
jgi:hypothetical protein